MTENNTTAVLDTRNATAETLVAILKDQRARRLDVVAPAQAITAEHGSWRVDWAVQHMDDQGVTSAAGLYRPTRSADQGMADKTGIGQLYLSKLRSAGRMDLYDGNVNGWLHGGGDIIVGEDGPALEYPPDARSFLVRILKDDDSATGVVRALLSSKYLPIENLDILMATLDGIRQSGTRVDIDSCDLNDHRMYVRFVAPDLQVNAAEFLANYRNPFGDDFARWNRIAHREGMGYGDGEHPVVFGGFVFSNSETGNGSYWLRPQMIVKVCRNGLTIPVEGNKRQVHRGAELDEGILEMSADTLAKQLALITAKTRDSVQSWMTKGWLQDQVDDVTAVAAKTLADPAAAVREVVARTAIPKGLEDDLLGYFLRGGQATAGGVGQAVSAMAQMVPDPDLANTLEELAIPAMAIAAKF